MGQHRIIYQDWIVALGRDPSEAESVSGEDSKNQMRIAAVNMALERLDHEEASFIRAFYMQGLGYAEISRITGRTRYRLESLHKIALRRLHHYLSPVLFEKSDHVLTSEAANDCLLCRHLRRQEIDAVIRRKKPEKNWRMVLQTLREEFGLKVNTPQLLIGHSKYHMMEESLPWNRLKS